MTAIDRRQIIEDLARAWTDSSEGAQMWDGWADHVDYCPEGDACDSVILHDIVTDARRDATAALPVIVAAALKPIRDLHSPHARTQYDDQECEDSACDHYDELEDRWWCPGHPVWICRACDQGADGRVLAPCPTARLCDEIEAAATGGE